MLAIGAGGLDVAVAMGGGPYHLTMPRMVKDELSGRLQPWVSAKDIILEVLRRLTVKGGVGKIIEYAGDALAHLTFRRQAHNNQYGSRARRNHLDFPQ